MKRVWFFVLLACVQADCEWQFGNSCYQLLPGQMRYNEALQACSAMSARLMIPNSDPENQFIRDMILDLHQSDTFSPIWISCTDTQEEDKWVQAGDAGEGCNYANWAPREPNNLNGEGCAMMVYKHWETQKRQPGQWIDIACSESAHVICEYHNRLDMTCLQANADGCFA